MNRRCLRLLSLACLAVALSACGTTGTKVLDNVSNDCARKYDGTITAGITGAQFTGTVKIDCRAADGKTIAEASVTTKGATALEDPPT